jgi:hypothetical protein
MVRYGLDSDTSSDFGSALSSWEEPSYTGTADFTRSSGVSHATYNEDELQLAFRNPTLLIVL